MENGILKHIVNEKDLDIYEDYIKENYNTTDDSLNVSRTKQYENDAYKNQKMSVMQNRKMMPKTLTNPFFSNGYLLKHTGKLIKTESLIGNMLDCRIGILLDVGADYIALKTGKSCCSMMIPTSNIKYITIIHDNDISKAFNY